METMKEERDRLLSPPLSGVEESKETKLTVSRREASSQYEEQRSGREALSARDAAGNASRDSRNSKEPKASRNSIGRGSSRGKRGSSPKAPKSALQAAQTFSDPESQALHLMKCADSHSRNGSLTVTEMQTFLRGTPHEDFMLWVTKTKQWLAFDRNRSGTMELEELRTALHGFYAAKARGEIDIVPSKSGSASPMSSRAPSTARSQSPKSEAARKASQSVSFGLEETNSSRRRQPKERTLQKELKDSVQNAAETVVRGEPRWALEAVRAEVAELKSKDLAVRASDEERSKLQSALRQYREQDYDDLLAAKTREIELLQRRTEEKMSRLGQAKRPDPNSREPIDPLPKSKAESASVTNSGRRKDVEVPNASELAAGLANPLGPPMSPRQPLLAPQPPLLEAFSTAAAEALGAATSAALAESSATKLIEQTSLGSARIAAPDTVALADHERRLRPSFDTPVENNAEFVYRRREGFSGGSTMASSNDGLPKDVAAVGVPPAWKPWGTQRNRRATL